MATKTKLKVGDKVRVPLGVNEVKGVIVNISGPPGQRYVLVRMPIRGSSGETLEETEASFPERSLTLASQ
jgi:hypothetical protein